MKNNNENTTRYTPQYNGFGKIMNSMLIEKVICILSGVGLSQGLWENSMDTTCYFLNPSPTSTLV